MIQLQRTNETGACVPHRVISLRSGPIVAGQGLLRVVCADHRGCTFDYGSDGSNNHQLVPWERMTVDERQAAKGFASFINGAVARSEAHHDE